MINGKSGGKRRPKKRDARASSARTQKRTAAVLPTLGLICTKNTSRFSLSPAAIRPALAATSGLFLFYRLHGRHARRFIAPCLPHAHSLRRLRHAGNTKTYLPTVYLYGLFIWRQNPVACSEAQTNASCVRPAPGHPNIQMNIHKNMIYKKHVPCV